MITLKRKDIRELVRDGNAIDVTNYNWEQAQNLRNKGIDKIAVSYGLYGLNGALYIGKTDRLLYAVTGRAGMLDILG